MSTYHQLLQEDLLKNPPKFIPGYGDLSPVERLALATKPRRSFKLQPIKDLNHVRTLQANG